MLRTILAAAVLIAGPAVATTVGELDRMGIGTPVSPDELAVFFAILPDGEGLPPGSGTAGPGKEVYAEKCAMCHGDKLEAIYETGAPPLAGGTGTLATDKPLKTVESYWPYASTLFDYIWRTMPFHEPGSLTPDEVYALTAYILSVGKIVGEDTVLDAQSLPQIKMPNVGGFYVDPGPDRLIYRPQQGTSSK